MSEECEALLEQLEEGIKRITLESVPAKMAIAVNRKGMKHLKRSASKCPDKKTQTEIMFSGLPVYFIPGMPEMYDFIITDEELIKKMAKQYAKKRKPRRRKRNEINREMEIGM